MVKKLNCFCRRSLNASFMPIMHLIIPSLSSRTKKQDIANVFWKLRIAQIFSIVFIPYVKNNKPVQMAFIEIAVWCDSEVAYSAIQRLNKPEGEVRVIYKDDNWWAVYANPAATMPKNIFATYFFPFYYDNIMAPEKEKEKKANANVTLRKHQLAF